LAPGDYKAVVYDVSGSGCDAQAPVSLETATPVVFTTTKEEVSCNGGSDGSIEVILDASNDNPPYTFTIDDGVNAPITQNSKIFTGLAAGTYTITVTSDRGCSDTQVVTINEPAQVAVSATATDFACADNSVSQAVITASGSGGTAPYMYSMDGVNFFTNANFNINDTGSAEVYTITIRDANGCTEITSVSVETINVFTASVSKMTDITCTNDEQVEINVLDNGNASNSYTYELLPLGNPDGIQTLVAGTTATYDLSTPGDYIFRVTDNDTGCYFMTAPYTVAPYDLIDVVATAITPVTCFGDSDGVM
ncbi:SprB repeat-containing protein, partial [Arenibacter certesii]|uniref:SprB repeat-containing protein n=1 Tax=Arenibacter certesii TaxID=228955 RepID=UPI001679F640